MYIYCNNYISIKLFIINSKNIYYNAVHISIFIVLHCFLLCICQKSDQIIYMPMQCRFYVDHVPIREITRSEAMGGDYPSKPMSLYATIWDASSWATDGGKYPVKYEFEPFVSEFTDFVLEGCPVDPIEQVSAGSTISASASACSDKKEEIEAKEYSHITPEGRKAMRWFRENYMYYSHCYDTRRYPVPLPECVIVPSEQARFKETGRLNKFGSVPKRPRRRKGKGRKHQKKSKGVENQGQADM